LAPHSVGGGLVHTLVRGAALPHGGQVRVESSSGAGTTFILELPYDVPTRGEARPHRSVQSANASSQDASAR
jgi:signal transduction histidine kinase